MRASTNSALIRALGVELKVCRLERGLTQEELAARADLDRPYVTLIEAARKQPTLSVLHRLATALELPLGVFLTRVERRYLDAPENL